MAQALSWQHTGRVRITKEGVYSQSVQPAVARELGAVVEDDRLPPRTEPEELDGVVPARFGSYKERLSVFPCYCILTKAPEHEELFKTGDDRMSNTLRKGEMSRRVAEAMGCSNGEGGKALKAVIESVTDAMRAGDRIVLTGFGTFERKEVKARRVRPIGAQAAGS